MTDREKLIALIKEGECGALGREDCSYCKYDGEDDCSYQLLADVLIANGVTFATDNHVGGKWIPVTERLPKADAGDVLVVKNYRGKTYVDIGEIIEGEAYCYSDDYAIHPREHKLTHWMPLPEPPMRRGENG